MTLISCNNLSIGYDNQVVVENLNLNIENNDYLVVVGENGAGKSTFIKTLLGLINPLDGKITYENGLNKNEIGYLPQQTLIQKDFPASVGEVVISGCINSMGLKPFYTKKEKQIAQSNIKKMGIENIINKSYRDLSGGQQQRVLLARALCATKKILLLDEPVAGLDPRISKEMYSLIKSINDEGITVIMISHDIDYVLEYANKVLHISKTPFFGSKDDYLNSEQGKKFINKEENNNE